MPTEKDKVKVGINTKVNVKDAKGDAKDQANPKDQAGGRKAILKNPEPSIHSIAADQKPSGFIGEVSYNLQNCLKNAREEITKACVIVKQKVEQLQQQWLTGDDESVYTKPPAMTDRSSRHSVHKKYNADVAKAVDEGDFKKIGAALERNYSDKYFETRLTLSAAHNGHKLHNVEWALDQLQKHNMTSPAITKIREDTAIKRLRKDLHSALNSKNLNTLDCFAWEAFNDRVRNELGQVLTDAIELRNRLNRLRCIRMAILHTDDTALFDIFNNKNPSPALHATMAAVYLLLGKSAKYLNVCSCVCAGDTITSWPTIQKLLKNKDPKKTLKTLVSKFSGDVTADAKSRAQRLLDAHDQQAISESSQQALVFYIWAQAMLKEMETQNATTLSRIFANM